jgi:hypothetical protein
MIGHYQQNSTVRTFQTKIHSPHHTAQVLQTPPSVPEKDPSAFAKANKLEMFIIQTSSKPEMRVPFYITC